MNPERWQQIKGLYNSALELEPSRRETFLREACAGDESVRKEIERLLAQQAEAEDLLGRPALEVAAVVLAQGQKNEPQANYVCRSLLHFRITERIKSAATLCWLKVFAHDDQAVSPGLIP